MRLELEFELLKPELPQDHKSIWISYLKNVMSTCNDGKFFDEFFAEKKSKDYCFSMIFSKPKYKDKKILLQGNHIKMIFSASDHNLTGAKFYMAFIENKGELFALPNKNFAMLKSIRKLEEQEIQCNRILIKTVVGGGLLIRKHDRQTNTDQYYTYKDDGFVKQAKEILSHQAKLAGFSNDVAGSINIKPIDCKKIVVLQYGIYVDVTKGMFILEGTPELLQYYYQAGLGSKHSMGYGLIDIVAQDRL